MEAVIGFSDAALRVPPVDEVPRPSEIEERAKQTSETDEAPTNPPTETADEAEQELAKLEAELARQETSLPVRKAMGIQVIASTDNSPTDIVRIQYQALFRYEQPEEYLGVTVEGLYVKAFGGPSDFSERVYVDYADNIGSWDYEVRLGSDGSTAIGRATIHNADWSQRYFIERDIVETFDGVDLGIYGTLIGANFASYLDDKNTLEYGFGLTEYVGKNTMFYAEGGYTRWLNRRLGLNAQLELRYEHNTFADEFDYYAPANRYEVMPIIAFTRFSNKWSYNIEGGYGLQNDSNFGTEALRYINLWLSSPDLERGVRLESSFVYSNTSFQFDPNFDYFGGNISLMTIF